MVEFWNRFARPTEVERPETIRRWLAMSPDASRIGLIVEAGGAIAATATASDGGVFRQPDGSFRGGVRVDPTWRRRGVASALLDQIEAHARARGAPKLRGSVRGDEPEGLAFAEARGYREYHRRYQSYLDVQAFDPSGFPDPERTAAAAAVRLASYGQLLAERDDPEPLQREIYDLSNSMLADIPRPDMFTPPPFEKVRNVYFGSPTLDHRASVYALKDGRVVGMTITDVNEAGLGYTFFTGVVKPYRGQGLATALKLLAIAALRERGVRWLGTTNDEANAPMRGINERLGYRVEPPSIQVEKALQVEKGP